MQAYSNPNSTHNLDSQESQDVPDNISVIIPTLNEASKIQKTIEAISETSNIELIVVDGGSQDSTCKIAKELGARVLSGPLGRGPQMNHGATSAKGSTLLFLHADTWLPSGCFQKIRETLQDKRCQGGAFQLSIRGEGFFYRFITVTANLRSKFLGAPYGDQALFVRKSAFVELGGYKSLKACEDLDFVRRLRKLGRVTLLATSVSTSARRWETHGRIKTTARNILLFFRYFLGLLPKSKQGEPE